MIGDEPLSDPDFVYLNLEGICAGNEDAPVCADAAIKGHIPAGGATGRVNVLHPCCGGAARRSIRGVRTAGALGAVRHFFRWGPKRLPGNRICSTIEDSSLAHP